MGMQSRSVQPWIKAQDRVRMSQNWVKSRYRETQLIVQETRYMPRIQLDSETIYLSWGSQIWAHPRRADGTVCRTASQVLRAHSDDVSRFVTKDGLLVSGGRDKTIKIWQITDDIGLSHMSTINIGDRVWSLATSNRGCVAVGSAGLYGIPSLTLLDLTTGTRQDLGTDLLRKGAGMLDLTWIDNTKFLSCGYDSHARLWDVRTGSCVSKWEEPFNEAN